MTSEALEIAREVYTKIQNVFPANQPYAVVLFGSYVQGDAIPGRSDIDIAIVTFSCDRSKNRRLWEILLSQALPHYDLRIFELLPLYLQMEIINKHQVIIGDPLELSEYFYYFRSLWGEMQQRFRENQFQNIKEQIVGIQQRKRLLAKTVKE